MKTKKKPNNARQAADQPRRSYSAEYTQQSLCISRWLYRISSDRPLSPHNHWAFGVQVRGRGRG